MVANALTNSLDSASASTNDTAAKTASHHQMIQQAIDSQRTKKAKTTEKQSNKEIKVIFARCDSGRSMLTLSLLLTADMVRNNCSARRSGQGYGDGLHRSLLFHQVVGNARHLQEWSWENSSDRREEEASGLGGCSYFDTSQMCWLRPALPNRIRFSKPARRSRSCVVARF